MLWRGLDSLRSKTDYRIHPAQTITPSIAVPEPRTRHNQGFALLPDSRPQSARYDPLHKRLRWYWKYSFWQSKLCYLNLAWATVAAGQWTLKHTTCGKWKYVRKIEYKKCYFPDAHGSAVGRFRLFTSLRLGHFVLKNSVFHDDERFPALQVHWLFSDTRGC